MSAASAARRTDPELPITVLEAGPHCSYGVCGIPYYLGGVVPDPMSLVAHPLHEYVVRRRIDLRLNTRATKIDLAGRVAETSGGERIEFSRLVYAAGAAPIVPPLLRLADPRVVTVRTLQDAIRLRAQLGDVRAAVIVGAGYVGLEVADCLALLGIPTTVVDRLPRVMGILDEEVAIKVEEEVRRHADVVLGASLRAVRPVKDRLRVELDDRSLSADLVVLALGVRPNTSLLAGAGLQTTAEGALVVDPCLRTSAPGVLAAGDSVAYHHRLLGRPAYVPLGPAANKTGRVAGVVAAGGQASFRGIVGTAVVKVFDLTVAHTGLSLEAARNEGLDAVATEISARSRAKYYPGAAPLHVRLVHERSGRLLGCQLVGTEGVATRIDVVAAALYAGLDIEDLAAFDLAYAPPYSPVYDPLTQAAQAAQHRSGTKRVAS